MGRLTLLIAGGSDEERAALTDELFEKLQINSRTDDAAPRIWRTDDDPDDLRLTNLTSW